MVLPFFGSNPSRARVGSTAFKNNVLRTGAADAIKFTARGGINSRLRSAKSNLHYSKRNRSADRDGSKNRARKTKVGQKKCDALSRPASSKEEFDRAAPRMGEFSEIRGQKWEIRGVGARDLGMGSGWILSIDESTRNVRRKLSGIGSVPANWLQRNVNAPSTLAGACSGIASRSCTVRLSTHAPCIPSSVW